MSKEIEKSEFNKTLPAIVGLDYAQEIASELPSLAAGLVHEVKNPLAAIHLHLQLLQNYINEVEDRDLQQRMNDKVVIIQKQILSLNQLLQDFFRLIRPVELENSAKIDINSLVLEIIKLLEVQARREGVELEFQPGDLLPGYGPDSGFMKQIVVNLILNAIQSFDKGEKSLMKDRKVRIETYRIPAGVGLSIADNGRGIPDDVIVKIFDPFFTTRKEGSGLGLALVKKMISVMGGRIDVESHVGQGTTFHLSIPIMADNQKDHSEITD